MTRHLHAVLTQPDLAASLAECGLATVRNRHTCAHRVDELMAIVDRVIARRLVVA